MTKKKTETIAKKKSSPKYPWKDYINKSNNKKQSSLCVSTIDGDKFSCSIVFLPSDNIRRSLYCTGPGGMIFSRNFNKFKTLSSAKIFAEKELEKRLNMKNVSFNRF